MPASLCIHGHFYQPPREDPWLGCVLTEATAAPMHNWNERILRESYAPLAWARRQDFDGRITEIINCYEWINFNVGPTLMHWLRRQAPETLKHMLLGDALSRERLGHGNAMAQSYHHVIMPLAPARDKLLETAWAMDDFRYHFGRESEGMWLPECAVDTATLEILVSQGVRFVVLAPGQAKAVIMDGESLYVNENTLNVREPYRVELPSGASITVVFYHGALSRSIAFEGLLHNGELFWQYIADKARALEPRNGGDFLLCMATDGETYGHHFTFGEMALAHVLAQAAGNRDNIRLTNLAAYIAANPPVRQVVLHEPSAWSCAHGVERWRSDCGCSNGGHGGWNQKWRAPLRKALDIMRRAVDAHYNAAGAECFDDPDAALVAYGKVLADPALSGSFAARWFRKGSRNTDRAWKLLAMQEQALAAFASCAWFFDDIARIEPENAMTFALRAMELMRQSNGPDVSAEVLTELDNALSNQAGAGSGKDIFLREVLPRRDDDATLCLLAWLMKYGGREFSAPPAPETWDLPNVSITITPEGPENPEDPQGMQRGAAVIRPKHEKAGRRYSWRLLPPDLKSLPGKTGLSLADCRIEILPEKTGARAASSWEQSRPVSEMARPMREFLLGAILKNREQHHRSACHAMAGHVISLTAPWLDRQSDVPAPEFWLCLLPYILLESMYNDGLSIEQRMQLEHLLSLHISARTKALGRLLVQEAFLAALAQAEKNPDNKRQTHHDATFANWVRRVRFIMPDMDWWIVQNTVWDLGLERYPALARELGFLQDLP